MGGIWNSCWLLEVYCWWSKLSIWLGQEALKLISILMHANCFVQSGSKTKTDNNFASIIWSRASQFILHEAMHVYLRIQIHQFTVILPSLFIFVSSRSILSVADVSTPLQPAHPTTQFSLSAARAADGAGAHRPTAVHQADVQNWWAALRAGSVAGWVFTLLCPPLAPC